MRKKPSVKKRPEIEIEIENLLEVSPLNSRLEASLYIYIRDNDLVCGGDQQKCVDLAKNMAEYLRTYSED
jgi:hypothetical protein